ncbi:hypothetical protein [Nonomuraea sp. B19D2]|uniref:hypothetical protein n=1 Tax=Nonomuraea sp. B19D2 TaxID=3159561 RepID=UPI0032DA884E
MSDRYLRAVNYKPLPSPGATPINFGGGTGHMGAVPMGSHGPKVMGLLRNLGRLSLWLVALSLIADVTGADEGEIARAGVMWTSMGQRLDDGAKFHLGNLRTVSEDWKAADKRECLRVAGIFSQETAVLRGDLVNLGNVLDEIAAAFRAYWVTQWTAAVATLASFLRIAALKLLPAPQVSIAAMLLERTLGLAATSASVALAGSLIYLLATGRDVMAALLKKALQFGYIFPTGDAEIDFSQATLDVKHFPTFKEPPAPGKLPAGSEGFDFVAPDVQTTTL